MKRFSILSLGFILLWWPALAFASPKADLPPPADLRFNPAREGIYLIWTPLASPAIQGYNLYIKKPRSKHLDRVTDQPVQETSVHFRHMKPGGKYAFEVAGVDAQGLEGPRSRLELVAMNPGLSPPRGFRASVTDQGIQLLWNKPNWNVISGFQLYLADETGEVERRLTAGPITENQVTLTKLRGGKTYRFLLTALWRDGQESAFTQVLEVVYSGPPAARARKGGGTPKAPGGPPGPFYIEFAGGVALPAQNWSPAYNWGSGGTLSLGCELNPLLSVQMDLGGFYYSGGGYYDLQTEAERLCLISLRCHLGNRGFRPYLLAGAGVDLDVFSDPDGNFNNIFPDVEAGAGFEFPLTQRSTMFFEGICNVISNAGTYELDVPVLAGVRVGL